MRVLVTGDAGRIGRHVVAELRGEGHDVRGFDIARGEDVRDVVAVRRAVDGCAAVVHAAALASDKSGTPDEIFATNVSGTWNVLAAARDARIERFVLFSSVQVFGTSQGEQPPLYFPIDDDHPRRATRPYGLSKCFAEDMCDAMTRDCGMPTIALRPVAVWEDVHYQRITNARRTDPSFEWTPFWEYGAFVDVRDVATAVSLALRSVITSSVRATLCASDLSGSAPSRELVDRLLPAVPWRDGMRETYEADPWRALFDTSVARDALGWEPQHTWHEWAARAPADGEASRRRFPRRVRRS